MREVMRDGGNAFDAAIAGCLVQATVQHDMTNHTGTVVFLCWDAKKRRTAELNSMGTIVPDLAPFRPIPCGAGLYATGRRPCAVIPGFMPGMKAIFERFATKPWDYLCAPAVRWAETGHEVGSYEHYVVAQTVDRFYTHTPSGREHFTPDGHFPQVGDTWRQPVLAKTIARLSAEGPDYFITGDWARHFVERANQLGWPIELEHMRGIPPRWGEGLRYQHREYEIVQFAPPQRQAVFCSLVLGILQELGVSELGHYSESAEALYYMAHALRRAEYETGFIHDPEMFDEPTAVLMAPEYHKMLAGILRIKPKVDLTRHISLTRGEAALNAAGATLRQPVGSCELSIVDAEGNWVQMMNTLQSGGIPGEVVDGVPMVGSHGAVSLTHWGAWLTGGGRMSCVNGSTLVLKDGEPVLALGTPGNVGYTVAQVLSNILDYRMDPYAAEDAPRMLPIQDDLTVAVESRLSPSVVSGLATLGVLVDPLPRYHDSMGSFQMSWRDKDGTLHGVVGPRRAGTAAAL
jgi:gamma-glutamyltranspeptidase/glutathione hydrolase